MREQSKDRMVAFTNQKEERCHGNGAEEGRRADNGAAGNYSFVFNRLRGTVTTEKGVWWVS